MLGRISKYRKFQPSLEEFSKIHYPELGMLVNLHIEFQPSLEEFSKIRYENDS